GAALDMRLDTLDWIVLGLYGVVCVAIGLAVARRGGQGRQEFFLSGRRLSWWLLGVSLVATTFSTDTPNLITDLVRTGGVSQNWVWWAFAVTGMCTVFFYAKLWRRSAARPELDRPACRRPHDTDRETSRRGPRQSRRRRRWRRTRRDTAHPSAGRPMRDPTRTRASVRGVRLIGSVVRRGPQPRPRAARGSPDAGGESLRWSTWSQFTPTLPCTDAISLAESYPTPSLKTSVTFRMTDGSATRSPCSTTRSASLPRSTVPRLLSTPRIFAPFAVMMCTACAGVKPASMNSS